MRSERELRELFGTLQENHLCQVPPITVSRRNAVGLQQVAVKVQLELLAWVLEEDTPTHLPMYGGDGE